MISADKQTMRSTYRFDGQTALVTGGGGGMGKAAVQALFSNGANVVAVDWDRPLLEASVQEIDPSGTKVAGLSGDIGDPSTAENAVKEAVNRFGNLDIFVNCAGISPRGPILGLTDKDWLHVVQVNLNGTFFMSRAAATVMKKRGSGTIVLIASDRGLLGAKEFPAYAASKGGVIAFMRSIAQELGPYGITVNAINPGLTETPMTKRETPRDQWEQKKAMDPMGKLSMPEDIAEIIMFLAGPARSFMTGQLITTRVRFG